MNRTRVIIALALSYALLGVLMNSVGVVILQAIRHFDASKPMGSTLEACKDLSVVTASFLLATRIPRFGYRPTLIAEMAGMALACLAASFATAFVALQLLFVATGFAFGLAKVATYSTIGLVARDADDHAAITGLIEGVFMVGILAGIWLFGWFVKAEAAGQSWLVVYRVLSVAFLAAAALWLCTPVDERAARNAPAVPFASLARLAVMPATLLVLAAVFLYVLIEQGIGTWLPTFNAEVLRLPPAMSVELSSIFIAALALGRLGSGPLFRCFGWLPVLLGCLVAIASLVLISLPLAGSGNASGARDWLDAPLAAFLFPLIGVVLAPIYPTICSVALSSLPTDRHAALIGLIVIFSALGGTLGSALISFLFQHLPGATAFYFLLVPLALIATLLPAIRRQQARAVV